MKKLFLFVILFYSFYCSAQNYECLQGGVKHYFINSIGYLRGIRIDSVTTTGDSTIYYPFHTPRGSYGSSSMGVPDTLDGHGGSWLGKKVVRRGDGTFVFDNYWNDTVAIKTQASIGDTWMFCWESSSLYYIATVTGMDTATIEGVVDSVKTIHIIAGSPSGIVTTDPANNAEILLSKNHGFVQVMDLLMFPYHAPGTAYTTGRDYYLDGSLQPMGWVTSPGLNLNTLTFKLTNYTVPTYKDLYDWNEGDEYEYVYNPGFEQLSDSYTPPWEYFLDSVLSRSSTSFSNINEAKGVHSYKVPTPTYPIFGMTPYYITNSGIGTHNYDTASPFSKTLMPEETGQGIIQYYFPNDTSWGCDAGNMYHMVDNRLENAVYIPPFEDGPRRLTYKSPLGLIRDFHWAMDKAYDRKLIFYKKDGYACGTFIPLAVADNNQFAQNKAISIFPNPAYDELNITYLEKINTVTITNVTGQQVLHNEYNAEQVRVNISGLPAGMYFVRMNGVCTKKFVKE